MRDQVGAAVAALGAYRFVVTERDIEARRFRSWLLTQLMLTAAIVLGGVLLAVFVVAR